MAPRVTNNRAGYERQEYRNNSQWDTSALKTRSASLTQPGGDAFAQEEEKISRDKNNKPNIPQVLTTASDNGLAPV